MNLTPPHDSELRVKVYIPDERVADSVAPSRMVPIGVGSTNWFVLLRIIHTPYHVTSMPSLLRDTPLLCDGENVYDLALILDS